MPAVLTAPATPVLTAPALAATPPVAMALAAVPPATTLLVVATPALCQSRVCGPVVDIVLQVKQRYGNRVAFIHQEVYKDNDVAKGYRPQLTALHLRTEPWIFAVDRHGYRPLQATDAWQKVFAWFEKYLRT